MNKTWLLKGAMKKKSRKANNDSFIVNIEERF